MRYKKLCEILDLAFKITTETSVSMVPMLWGPPGVGKTQKTYKWVKERGYTMWSLLGTTLSPTDVICYMPDPESGLLRPCYNERLPDARRDPDAKGVIFLDEAPNTHPEVIKPFMKLCNEKRLDGLVIPKNVMFLLAGNRTSDRAGANALLSSFSNRLEHYEFTVEADEIVDYFIEQGYSEYITSYLMLSPDAVNRFDPLQRTWPNPRTWEQLAMKMHYATGRLDLQSIIASIGEATGKEFYSYIMTTDELPSKPDIIADPMGIDLPRKQSHEYAAIAMLSATVTRSEFEPISRYLRRFPLNRQVLFIKLLRKRMRDDSQNLKDIPAYKKWLLDSEVYKAISQTE